MREWRLVCPLSRLPVGRGVTALLDGEQVLVRRAQDGTLRADSVQLGDEREHDVRVQQGIVEVALRARVIAQASSALRRQSEE